MPTLTRDHLTTYAEPDVDLTETVLVADLVLITEVPE